MDIWHVFSLLGGVALFLYGMGLMGEGLELVAGSKMQEILHKLTTNRFLGIFIGFLVTAIIQSSSATTVMVVGFVNSSLMNLSQAINVIMGANIGTTVTGLFIALDIMKFAPLIAFAGLLLSMRRKTKMKYWSKVIFGLGLLFMGLQFMSDAMVPLRESQTFIDAIQQLSSPLLAVIVGMLFTALIQSSSASVGILQTLARQGLVPFSTSFYIVLGQNIGTCITSVLASIGSNKNAKRAALCHVLFNVFGTVLFLIVALFLPVQDFFVQLAPNQPAAQIAFLHTTFNISTTLVMLPFTKYLARIANIMIQGEDAAFVERKLKFVNVNTFSDNVVMLANIRREMSRMADIVSHAVEESLANVREYDPERAVAVRENLSTLKYLIKELNQVSVKLITRRLNKKDSKVVTNYISALSNFERISDYLEQILKLSEDRYVQENPFSSFAQEELESIRQQVGALARSLDEQMKNEGDRISVKAREEVVELTLHNAHDRHVQRTVDGMCTAQGGLLYNGLLSWVERITYHLMEISDLAHANGKLMG
ncbi:MAG: Na/Pi cotransporter family protein [Peptoniphilaceae bacterium]|nr:Na/Pi cotransporter family protein [Peptoniphilaceae bacterium]MDY6085499.1 Na/Pi cotransporter family protein [Peptoniphilaceae bacterium]